jgi:protocatechuate 3,4-dioxygenase beta subunit
MLFPMFCWIIISCKARHEQSNLNEETMFSKTIGGGCDGCELMYSGMPEHINPTDTSVGWHAKESHKLHVTGTVFKNDGKTPAPDVILYYWHTNAQGMYKSTAKEDAINHGDLRGWIKTDVSGRYRIYTSRPAPYPNDFLPAHIHISVKEPDLPNEYYCEDIVFDDDPLLIPYNKRYPPANRCGSGIVRILLKGAVQVAEHDIVLGLNIPDYPHELHSEQIESGLSIGEDQPSFIPFHVYGPDQNTTTCPVCKYGRYHGILFFANLRYDPMEMKTWLKFLEDESQSRKQYLKAYVVFNTNTPKQDNKLIKEIQQLVQKIQLQRTAITVVPSWDDRKTEVYLNKLNDKAKNTIIIYKHRGIVDKYVDIEPTTINLEKIRKAMDDNDDWFDLTGIKEHEE